MFPYQNEDEARAAFCNGIDSSNQNREVIWKPTKRIFIGLLDECYSNWKSSLEMWACIKLLDKPFKMEISGAFSMEKITRRYVGSEILSMKPLATFTSK